MGQTQCKTSPPTIRELTSACVKWKLPFTDATPGDKMWNHDPNDVSEVYPDIFISGGAFAQNLKGIEKKKITHVLNTAQGKTYMHVDTDENFYPDHIVFKGIEANDSTLYDLSSHFGECADFINDAIEKKGRVLVHCRQGFSRSPTIVAVYLMKFKGMTAKKALETIAWKRHIYPNEGFMKSLIALDIKLYHPDVKPDPETESSQYQPSAQLIKYLKPEFRKGLSLDTEIPPQTDTTTNGKVAEISDSNNTSHEQEQEPNDKQNSPAAVS